MFSEEEIIINSINSNKLAKILEKIPVFSLSQK
jgi:hypothetical protein